MKSASGNQIRLTSTRNRPEPLVRREASIVSPLRYPGGKRRLAAFIAETIRLNELKPALFVEPFAGGASVALQLLNDGCVEKIALGEKDPLVASFWKVVFDDNEWLIRRIQQIKPTLRQWEYYKTRNFNNDRARALACLFLNRTSFSGILAPGAGPIGGYSQQSEYKIDCRFNAAALIRRIRQAAALRDKVLFVRQGTWQQTIAAIQKRDYKGRKVFYYFDPPFYEKAAQLYWHYFSDKDHEALSNSLTRLRQPWILSYDPAPKIQQLYSHRAMINVQLLYSASGNGELSQSQELIVSNLPRLPVRKRLWRSAAEWKK